MANAFHETAPVVGCSEISTLPAPSAATHSEAEGQDTASSGWMPSTCANRHVPEAPAGSVDVATSPLSPTATHSDLDQHVTADIEIKVANGGR
jgi:hypothetical protein